MNVPNNNPNEIPEEPITSSIIWNQTISYTKAAAPLAKKTKQSSGESGRGWLIGTREFQF
jgi:hypothetical protein